MHAEADPQAHPRGGDLIYRQRRPTRIWHWLNALSVVVMLMSGLMIFNAHPELYWGKYGANHERPVARDRQRGRRRVPARRTSAGADHRCAGCIGRRGTAPFPPSSRSRLAMTSPPRATGTSRSPWLLVVPGLLYWLLGCDHAPRPAGPHADAGGTQAAQHLAGRQGSCPAALPDRRCGEPLQHPPELSYVRRAVRAAARNGADRVDDVARHQRGVAMAARALRRRQSARSIHFICACCSWASSFVHVAMVVLAGPLNELRSIVTGWYRLPKEAAE